MLFAIIGSGEREGEIKANFEATPFVYNINAHDWSIEEAAATLQTRQQLETAPPTMTDDPLTKPYGDGTELLKRLGLRYNTFERRHQWEKLPSW